MWPTVLGQVDGIAVGVEDSVFGFAVGRAFVDAGGGAEVLARFSDSAYVFDFEAEVIYSRLQLRPFDFPLRSDGDDRQVDMPVG
jgi:hypothetical protein